MVKPTVDIDALLDALEETNKTTLMRREALLEKLSVVNEQLTRVDPKTSDKLEEPPSTKQTEVPGR